jgi:hypothetical protein
VESTFATLFTYAVNGEPMWYVMPDGPRTPGTATYSGALYRTSGPPFNASPWTGINFAQVGNMSFTFTDGNSGTMTYTVDGVQVVKQITRQVFSVPKTQCES